MTLAEFYNKLSNRDTVYTYLVFLKYKYNYEEVYTKGYEIYYFDGYDYCWLNDWFEGQQDVEVIGVIRLDLLVDFEGIFNI